MCIVGHSFSAGPARAAATFLLALGLTLGATPATQAAEAQPTSANPALEARVQAITAELRCLVCQNQTVADSHSDLAGDLRNQVREMLGQGKSDQEVLDFMTARYGDFVLYRPPIKSTTMLLWVGPAVLMVGGLLALSLLLRRRARLPDSAFDADEESPNQAIKEPN